MYGLNIDPANEKGNPTPQQLKELGVELVRFSYKDASDTLSPDINRVNFYLSLLKAYSDAGIKALIIIAYESVGVKVAYEASDQEWGQYINLFSSRAGHLAAYFDAYSPAFQIWNEPDLPPQPGYVPSLREAVYGSMLYRTRQAIKTFSNSALVVGAGLCSGKPEYWANVVKSQPGKALIDINAFHPYGQRPEPDWPSSDWGFGYVGDLAKAYQDVFAGEWWITEAGNDTLSEEMKAQYLSKMYNTVKTKFTGINGEPNVQWLIWFCYSDGMVTPFGLIDGASNRKPAYSAYREMALNSGGAQTGEPVPV